MSCLIHAAKEACCGSHRSHRSAMRRHPVASVAGGLLTAAAIVGVISMMPDIIRYIRIKRM